MIIPIQWLLLIQKNILLPPMCKLTYLQEGNGKDNTIVAKGIGGVFTGIGCFDSSFSLQVKIDSKPYQVSSRYMAYM